MSLCLLKSDTTTLKHIYNAQVRIILCCSSISRLLTPMICSPKVAYISCVHWATKSGLNPLVSMRHTSRNWTGGMHEMPQLLYRLNQVNPRSPLHVYPVNISVSYDPLFPQFNNNISILSAGRSLWDRFHTLWASWAVEQRPYGDGYSASNPASLDKAISKIWFGGDTGLRSVPIGKKQEEMPICPVFKQIGERFGRFDLAVSFKLVSHVHILTPNQFFLFS